MTEIPYSNPDALLGDIKKKPVMPEIVQNLHNMLPGIATGLVERSQDMSDPANQAFAQEPDNPNSHSPKWHQLGVVSHSYEFGRAMRESIPAYLQEWGLAQSVDTALSEEVDGVPKRQLLQAVSLLHDVGKFTARKITRDPTTGAVSTSFEDHEVHSGEIVRGELSPVLTDWGLSPHQIDYIATCTELHFELGKVRRVSKAVGGYTMAFIDTPEFRATAQEIIDTHPDYALEIGLQFIADSLSKTEVVPRSGVGSTDQEIEQERPWVSAELERKHLDPRLVNQAMQQPINLKVTKAYLTQWADTSTVAA